MAKKLYVGNLSYNTHEEDLREAFSKIGEVLSATLIIDQTNGRSKGFGFVEMASDEDAAKAIASLNGTSFMDRTITVNEAEPILPAPSRAMLLPQSSLPPPAPLAHASLPAPSYLATNMSIKPRF